LFADLAVEHELHVAGTLELLEDQIIHATVGLDQCGRHDGEGTGFLGIACGRKKLARNFHGSGIHTTAHGTASATLRVVKGAADTGQGIHQNKDILALLDETLGTVNGDLGNPGVAAEITVVGTGVEFGLRHGASDLGHLLGAFVHEQDDEFHLGVILHHGIGDVLEQGGLAGAGRGYNESTLTFADGRHQVDHACGESLWHCFQRDALIRTDRGQLLKERDVDKLLGGIPLDLGRAEKLGAPGTAACLPLDENAVTQRVLTDHLGSDENIVLCCGISALGFAQESKPFSRKLHDSFGKSRLGRRSVIDR